MATAPSTWSDRTLQAIGMLAARPWSLLCVLLAINALARPYAGIIHDAQLYSAQVLNHLQPGTYSDDLFFRYGSQDQFSIFSTFVAPLVDLLGLQAAFFLLYLVFNSLFILALQRLVETLIKDRLVSTLALVFMMVARLDFGGLSAFNVQENFLTSRVMANTLVLFGLERTLKGRFVSALGLLVLALACHPVMAFGGVLIWAGCLAWSLLPSKWLVFLCLFIGGAGAWLLATPAVAGRLFGTMDEQWRQVSLRATPFLFPSEWVPTDWLNIVMGLIGVGAGAYTCWRGNRSQGRFLWVVTIVSVAAAVTTCMAESLPYALLLQGQPYRALWILKVLQIPFAFWYAARLWDVAAWYGPLITVVLVGVLGLTTSLMLEWFFPLFFLPVLVVLNRGLNRIPLLADWWRRSLLTSLILGFASCALYKLVLLGAGHATILRYTDTLEYGRILLGVIGPIPWLLLFAVFAGWASRRSDFRRGFQGTMLAVMLVVQCTIALLLALPSFRDNYTRYGKDIRFVQEFLRRRHGPAMPTIYSCLGRLDIVWLDLHAKSYFDWWQMSGVIFERPLAIEAQRRALVVGPFELDRFRVVGDVPEVTRMQASRFFALDFDKANPDLANLKQLCQEEGIDYLLLTHEFPGLVTAGNGRIFLYDCRNLRALLKLPPSTATSFSRHD